MCVHIRAHANNLLQLAIAMVFFHIFLSSPSLLQSIGGSGRDYTSHKHISFQDLLHPPPPPPYYSFIYTSSSSWAVAHSWDPLKLINSIAILKTPRKSA